MSYSHKQFQQLCEEFAREEQLLLDWKAKEYAADSEDRLLNFRQVAEFIGQTPAEVALAYLMKHKYRYPAMAMAQG